MKAKTATKKAAQKRTGKERPTVGERIIERLEQAIAWTRGENDRVRVTLVQVPNVDVRAVRRRMGLGQAEFAACSIEKYFPAIR